MRSLNPEPRETKNRLEVPSPWVILFELEASDVERVYLVNNPDPVTFNGITYNPFPLTIEVMEETLRGDLPSLNVTASNVSREIQAFLEHRNGLLDRRVRLTIVNLAHLGTQADGLGSIWTIRGTSADAESVTFRLSQHPFFDISFPHQKFNRNRCRWAFGSEECGWGFPTVPGGVAPSSSCDKTLNGPNGCAYHGSLYEAAGLTPLHPDRFGGFPSIPRRRV